MLVPVRAAMAQATGGMTGVVTDDTGAVVPGVTVEVVNQGTTQTRVVVTGADGFFAVPLLAPGQYSVKATLAGFKTTTREGVTVRVNDTARVDVTMAVGAVEEAVTVTGEAPLVETSHATLGIVIDEQKVVELPLNGRNFTQLGTLIPGVVAPPTGLGGAGGDATPGGFGAVTSGFSVNGMRNQSNNFLLDGSSNNDTFNTGFVLRPPPDAIQEFKILTHSYNAEYGRGAGSVVNVVTRSGTNQVHGGAWEFNRDDALQARNYFAAPEQAKPKLKQNQFGGALGGPLVRNRLFGFGYYEGHRNTTGVTQNLVVLSDAQRRGDFGSTTIRDPLTGLPFPNNVIPANRIDPAAAQLIERFVPPANTAPNRWVGSPDTTDDRDQYGVRVDYQLSQANNLLARYNRSETHAVQPAITRTIGTDAQATLQDYMASDTHVFSNNLINQIRVSYNRIGANPQATSGLTNGEFGINVPHNVPSAQGVANIAITGLFAGAAGIGGTGGLGDLQQPFVDRLNESFQFADDVTWVRGQHSVKLGLDVRKEHMFIAFVNRPNGDFSFTGVHTGNPRGRLPARAAGAVPPHHRQRQPGRQRLVVCRLHPGRVPPGVEPHAQPRPPLRPGAAVRREQRRAERLPPRPAVDAVPGRPGRPGLPGRRRRAARHLRDRHEQRVAARRHGLGRARRRPQQPADGLGPVLRHAGRPGRLLPERRAGAAVHAAARGELAAGADHPARSAVGDHRRRQPVPARAHRDRLGRGVRDARRRSTSTCRGSRSSANASAPRSATSARAARTCRSSSR